MMAFHLWINRHIDTILFWVVVIGMLTLAFGCAAVPPPVVEKETVQFEYQYCKAGVGGDYRILVPTNPDELPVLALFYVGGPYDKDHVICVISGDHSILDLGKGKQS